MNESEIRAISLFFYFSLLDDRKAIEAATETVHILGDKKNLKDSKNNTAELVAACMKIWKKNETRILRGRPNTSVQSGWQLQQDVDLGPWREFQKNATQDELLTLIWSKIIEINDEDLALGLKISQGTVRYRLGRALRKLGSMTQVVKSKYV
jgi:DNA-binding CsgD family transcriptional regulator